MGSEMKSLLLVFLAAMAFSAMAIASFVKIGESVLADVDQREKAIVMEVSDDRKNGSADLGH